MNTNSYPLPGHKALRLSVGLIAAVLLIAGCGSFWVAASDHSEQPAPQDPVSQVDASVTIDYAKVAGESPQYYGVEYTWVDQDASLYLSRYQRLYGNTVRIQITQEAFEPVNDNADPNVSVIDFNLTLSLDSENGKTLNLQTMITELVNQNPQMNFQINVWLAARWNASDPNGYLGLGGAFPPLDYAEHREFVRELARWLVDTCGVVPEHLLFTFINEPNLAPFFVGDQADLLQMASETRAALDQISPLIGMGGLDEVHGTAWTDDFYAQQPTSCCDFWTYHVYERGVPMVINALQTRAAHLQQYGPVWVTEFADTNNGSPDAQMDFSTPQAALGFAEMVGRLWGSGLQGMIHFRLSDSYTDLLDGGIWTGHGLFANHRGTHANGEAYAIFPAYWVFANLYREFGGGEIVATTSPPELAVVAARRVDPTGDHLAVWLTNSMTDEYIVDIQVDQFPASAAVVQIYDNLGGDTPLTSYTIKGTPLVLSLVMQARSSCTVVITPPASFNFLTYLPVVLNNSGWRYDCPSAYKEPSVRTKP